MRKFIVISIVLLMIAGFAITSSAMDVTLWAGQNINVGNLNVVIDGDFLVVTYNVTDPEWELGDTHLYVGIEPPTKSAPGRFPYGPEDAFEGVYTIDLDDFGGVLPLYIAAQAEVGKVDPTTGEPILDPDTGLPIEETVWAEGTQIRTGKNWAMYFIFPLED